MKDQLEIRNMFDRDIDILIVGGSVKAIKRYEKLLEQNKINQRNYSFIPE